ncbi:MAG: phytochelatin synthase family protein [Desulfobacterales bacterium]|nr:phytochelatin synthase family protein [Desulfobacterales bacterium]
MNLRRIIIHTYFYFPYLFHKITGTGAFGRNTAAHIQKPVLPDSSPLKTALLKHHVKQFHESSCSVASVVSVINAIQTLRADDHVPISQMDILEKVRTANWKERMSEQGDNGKRGLPLALLGEIVRDSLEAYGIAYQFIETVHAPKKPAAADKVKKILWQRLEAFEKKADGLVIAHFNQGIYVPTWNVPHISPVGGFDAATGQVTILDVDPQQNLHYKVSFDLFYQGLCNNYHHVLRLFGYRCGGYIYIKLTPPENEQTRFG